MSAFSDFMSVGSFWWGTGVGAIIAGTLGPLITAKSIKSSDKRKAAQEDKVAARTFEQDKKLQRDQLTREACAEFLRVSTVAFNTATDTKGLFNIARDLHTARTGRPDPLADQKIDFAETISAQTQTVAEAYSQLQMVAPREIVDKAIVLQTAVLAMLRIITQPMAKPVVANTVGEAIQQFVASVRKHLDRDELSNSTKEKAVMSYMDNLKRQVDEYLKEATADREASRRR